MKPLNLFILSLKVDAYTNLTLIYSYNTVCKVNDVMPIILDDCIRRIKDKMLYEIDE